MKLFKKFKTWLANNRFRRGYKFAFVLLEDAKNPGQILANLSALIDNSRNMGIFDEFEVGISEGVKEWKERVQWDKKVEWDNHLEWAKVCVKALNKVWEKEAVYFSSNIKHFSNYDSKRINLKRQIKRSISQMQQIEFKTPRDIVKALDFYPQIKECDKNFIRVSPLPHVLFQDRWHKVHQKVNQYHSDKLAGE